MKKKIVALILMVALLSTFFVGCSLFETDADRDYHQVIGNVSYNTKDSGTLTAVVYKGEVRTQINRYLSYLYQYGFDAEDIVEYCYNNVARQKLLLLYAQEYLYNNESLIPEGFAYDSLGAWNDFKNKDVKNQVEAYAMFLTVDELRYCIETVNKQFDEGWQDLIEDREKEDAKNEGNGETGSGDEEEDAVKDEDLLAARDQKDRTTDEEEEDEYEVNESIKTREDIVKYFAKEYDVTMDETKLSDAYFFNYANSLIKKEVNSKAKIMRSTLNELRKGIEDQFMDYEYFLVQQMQSRIIEKYTDHVGTVPEIVNGVTDKYDARYKELVDTAIKNYNDKDNSAYESAVGDQTFVYAAPSMDYLQVKSILLSFTDEQKSAISSRAEQYGYVEDVAKILRNAYATGIIDNDDICKEWALDVYADLGIKVNVSNPDYDPDEDKLIDAYTDASIKDKEDVYANPSVDYLTILAAMANDIQKKVDKAVNWQGYDDMSKVEQYLVRQYASQEAFNDWINLVNDDGGMVSTDVYAVTPEGESTKYVDEYTVLARALTSAGVGAIALEEYDDSKVAKQDNIDYAGTTEILKGGNGSYKLYKQNMSTSVGEYEKDKTAVVYTLVTEKEAKISFIVNEFGIHIVMVASLPVDPELGGISEQVKPDAADETKDKTFYVKNDNYLYEYSVKIEYEKEVDENGEETEEFTDVIKTITVEHKTIEEYLKETLKDELSSDVTNLQQLKLFGDDTYITKVDKVYKQVVKEVKKALEG